MTAALTEYTMVKGLHASLAEKVSSRFDPHSSILDIGAGAGAWLERLGTAGFENLYGIDKDPDRFRATKGQFIATNLDYEDSILDGKTFQLITSLFLKDDLPGDILCLLIRKQPQSCDP